jgi:hypothetical protein
VGINADTLSVQDVVVGYAHPNIDPVACFRQRAPDDSVFRYIRVFFVAAPISVCYFFCRVIFSICF